VILKVGGKFLAPPRAGPLSTYFSFVWEDQMDAREGELRLPVNASYFLMDSGKNEKLEKGIGKVSKGTGDVAWSHCVSGRSSSNLFNGSLQSVSAYQTMYTSFAVFTGAHPRTCILLAVAKLKDQSSSSPKRPTSLSRNTNGLVGKARSIV
jgi:hypothetical protein